MTSRLGWTWAVAVAVALAGCERQQTRPVTVEAEASPAQDPPAQDPPPVEPDAVDPAEASPPVEPRPLPEPEEPMKPPRPLDEILLAVEEIEGTPANLDDPEADYEARFEGKLALEREARRHAVGDVLAALEEAEEEGEEERGVRAFLCRVVGGWRDEQAHNLLGGKLRRLPLADVRRIVAAVGKDPESVAALGRWLGGQVRFARDTGAGDARRRLLLLEAYAQRGGADREVLDAAAKDPDAAVAERAAQLR